MEDKELTIHVDPVVEGQAEKVLNRLGVSLSTAVNMYFNQIVMTDSIPFDVKVTENEQPRRERSGDGEIQARIRQGYDDYNAGRMADRADLRPSGDHSGDD